MKEPKRVAAIVTEYRRHSHADVIIGKILEGFLHDGKEFPRMRLVSMHVDQSPEGDMSRALAKKHKFTIYDSIAGAVTLGKKEVAVDGVLCIGEHGKYKTNERGQILYPRRRAPWRESPIDPEPRPSRPRSRRSPAASRLLPC